MTIVVTNKQGQIIYSQMTDDSKNLNVTVAFLMQQASGDEFSTVVHNNGHDLKFNNGTFPIERLVRRVNGIVIRDPSPRKTAVTA